VCFFHKAQIVSEAGWIWQTNTVCLELAIIAVWLGYMEAQGRSQPKWVLLCKTASVFCVMVSHVQGSM
jgi:hypothetical protein